MEKTAFLNEINDPYAVANGNQEETIMQQQTQQVTEPIDPQTQMQLNPQAQIINQPINGNYNDPMNNDLDTMNTEPTQADLDIIDFQTNEDYSNLKLLDLFNRLRDNAINFKDILNNQLEFDMIKKNQLREIEPHLLNLNKFIDMINVYLDTMFEIVHYKKNLTSYLEYRNSYIKILKALKMILEV